MNVKRTLCTLLLSLCAYPAVVGAAVPDANGQDVNGIVKADGSSTVFPIAEAVAEEFQKAFKKVNVTVGVSGTGGGFTKFVAGEIDVVNASRPIKPSEAERAKANKIEYVELPVAYDALSIVVNPSNTWVDKITVKELATMWGPEAQGTITKWNQIRPSWPNKPLVLFGPGVDSGTYDYFTEAVIGKEDSSRGDYTNSEDDNILVKGVAGAEGGLGFMGLAYYENNTNQLKAVPVDDEKDANGKGPQMPTRENVIAGQYEPLARPLFIYVRRDSLERPEVREFVNFYLDNSDELATEVGYVALPETTRKLARERLDKKVVGTMYAGGAESQTALSLDERLKGGQGS